ncbi:MAG: glycosyltransferase family 4 protein [Chloroflexi bacterium]|nr:glycosyltransferase family 4 protein [Chloroflexota bacterium]
MKVCLLTAEYPPLQGGVGDFTRELARAMTDRGADVTVLTGVSNTPADGTDDVPWRVMRVIKSWGWGLLRQAPDLLRDLEPDAVNIQYQTAAYGMRPAVNLLPWWLRRESQRTRWVVTYHDVREPYLFPKAGRLREWITLHIARWSDAAIATNVEDEAWLRERLPDDYRLARIPIGSNIAVEPPAGYDRGAWRAQLGVSPDETLLAYFGFLNESKGGEDLVRALAELTKRGTPARLLMVGGRVGASDPTNEAYAGRVELLMAKLGVADHVIWTGYTAPEEVSANLLAADVGVLPYRDGASFRRGSFMALLAHGRPTVTTAPRVPIPELMDGENICLVPPARPVALADGIAALAADEAQRHRLGEGARQLARLFEWDGIARDTLALFEELTADS